MVDNRSQCETHDRQGWHVLARIVGERTDVLRVRYRCFQFAPRNLERIECHESVKLSVCTNPFVVDFRAFDLQPARPHNFALEHKELEGARVCSKYPSEIRAAYVGRHGRFCKRMRWFLVIKVGRGYQKKDIRLSSSLSLPWGRLAHQTHTCV